MQDGTSLYEKVRDVITPILQDANIELVELNVRQKRGDVFIQVLADRPGGGIQLDDCTALNRRIARIFDEEEFLKDKYILEVSSPGIDRPLRTASDFSRALGKDVNVYLGTPVDSRLEYTGTVKKIEEGRLTLTTPAGDVVLPLETINKGQRVI